MVRIPGTTIQFADGPMVVPPLSLAAIEALQARISAFTGSLSDCSIVIDCLHLALRRNYPDVTREAVAEMVGMENMQDVMDAVMKTSGFEPIGDNVGKPAAASP